MKRIIPLLLLFALTLAACGTAVPGGIVYRTADPALSFFMPVAGAGVVPVVEADPLLVEIIETEEPQVHCDLAGNINGAGEKILHLPTGAYWSRVHIDLERGEKWFCDIDSALAEGWRLSSR